MTQDQAILEEIYQAVPSADFQEEPELSFVDVITFFIRWKKVIATTTALGTVAAVAAILLRPPSYTAEATILPPQQEQSSLAAMASGAMGGIAASGIASQLGLKNPADLYIGILKSRTITDAIIQRFHLQQIYHEKLMSGTRKSLEKHASFNSGKESIITISVQDADPRRAAAMANAYVDELHNQNSRLALTDASQRRLFFEGALKTEKDALANAEVALKSTQQSTGLLAPSGQAELLIRSGAQLRAEIATRQVEIESMRSFATDENPKLQVLKREIVALQGQLNQVEANGSGAKLEVSGNRLPEASLEYIRKMRDVRYHETLFELLSRQYEAARLDEAKQAPLIQVVDSAVVPDKQSRPSRIITLAGCMLGAFGLGSLIAFMWERWTKLRSELSQSAVLNPALEAQA